VSHPNDTGPRAVLGVIPARYGASRFPGKPLAPLWGRPLLQHVWERARGIAELDALLIATDDERIAAAARGWGAEVEMTSPACRSGTDRVAEVARRRPELDIVVNLQGDEPELDVEAVNGMVRAMRDEPAIGMATLAHRVTDPMTLAAPDVVKVVVDAHGFALYFSRADVAAGSRGGPALRHVGVYGFRRDLLLAFAGWPPGELERAESLEQLRALEHGVRIRVLEADGSGAGVDTREQLEMLERRGPRGRNHEFQREG
jgi:3-deoxy-manno-octulosonate cytidylyltransferase (CMP-KDO synthetase)